MSPIVKEYAPFIKALVFSIVLFFIVRAEYFWYVALGIVILVLLGNQMKILIPAAQKHKMNQKEWFLVFLGLAIGILANAYNTGLI